jgi:hypothetical protein
VNYNTVTALCTASGLECNGYEDAPGFTNPNGRDFTLLASSPNIDRGIVIPGINDDFKGNAPDAGAYEVGFDPPPMVSSILRVGPTPTNAATVNFTITFSEPVTGPDTTAPFADFLLVADPGITGASITNVMPVSGSAYTISVNTGSGNGMMRLDVIDDDSIVDSRGQPLGGTGAGNGSYSAGQVYTINKNITNPVDVAFRSAGPQDGWVLESGETTNVGGALDRNATTFFVGDDARDKQYRGILSFNTSSLPDNAVIISALLEIKRQGIVGTDPFGSHGALLFDIRSGAFADNAAVQAADFAAAASPGTVRDQFSPLTFTWYRAQFSDANLLVVNRFGTTQFRIGFDRDDNDDLGADYLKFFSGNAPVDSQPKLLITYYVP